VLPQGANLAELIREVRTRLGLTQEKFAARLGVTLPTVNRWENGRARPSPLATQNLLKLISSMGIEGKDLMARCFSE
jgi:putative transcriptional regulator